MLGLVVPKLYIYKKKRHRICVYIKISLPENTFFLGTPLLLEKVLLWYNIRKEFANMEHEKEMAIAEQSRALTGSEQPAPYHQELVS